MIKNECVGLLRDDHKVDAPPRDQALVLWSLALLGCIVSAAISILAGFAISVVADFALSQEMGLLSVLSGPLIVSGLIFGMLAAHCGDKYEETRRRSHN
jgi:hypothetical protein